MDPSAIDSAPTTDEPLVEPVPPGGGDDQPEEQSAEQPIEVANAESAQPPSETPAAPVTSVAPSAPSATSTRPPTATDTSTDDSGAAESTWIDTVSSSGATVSISAGMVAVTLASSMVIRRVGLPKH